LSPSDFFTIFLLSLIELTKGWISDRIEAIKLTTEKNMFVRIKKNKSGSQTVLLIKGERHPDKKHCIPKIIKNFGVSRDAKVIDELKKQAEEYKAKLEAESPKAKILKIITGDDVKSCCSYNVGFSDIYQNAFNKVFGKLELKNINRLRDLVTMRIAAPSSKLRTANLADEYGIALNVDNIYKFMDKLNIPTIESIKQTIYQHTAKLLNNHKEKLDVLFYDLTTIYFETGTQDEIRDFGFSKDGKHQHVQIMLAVIVTKEGLPVDYEEFPGNCYEGHTLIPVLNKIKKRYNIDKSVLVADAALMNKINLSELDQRGIQYVIAARIKNAKKNIKDLIFNTEGYQDMGFVSDNIKAKAIPTDEGDLIVSYHSSNRARKDKHDRTKALEKIKKHIDSTAKSKLTSSLKKPYVKVSKNCKINIDYNKLDTDQKFDGFFGLRTNIKNANPADLLASYRGLWQVEQTFRIAKNNLEIRPVFHYSPRRIRAHFVICYIALALVRYVCFSLKRNSIDIPCERLHLLLGKMRKTLLVDSNDEAFEFLEDPPSELIPVYMALKINWHPKFQHKVIL